MLQYFSLQFPQIPKTSYLLQGIQLAHQCAALDSHLSVAVVVFAAHKTNYMCSNKRPGSKKQKDTWANKNNAGPREEQTTNKQTANIKHDLLKCTQLFIGIGAGDIEGDWSGVGDGEVVVVGARSRSWGNYWGCT